MVIILAFIRECEMGKFKNNHQSERKKLIIFDCDGVLVQSEEITLGVLANEINKINRIDNEHDLVCEDNIINEYRGKKIGDCLKDLESKLDIKIPRFFENNLRKICLQEYKIKLKATHGIYNLLSNLEKEICVASSSPRKEIVECLKITKLYNYFDSRIFSCYELGKWKPDPYIFKYACEKMGFLPEEALIIEDSVAGVQAAVAANIDVLGFTTSSRKYELRKNGAICITNIDEINNYL